MDLLKLERISLAGMVEMYLAGTILEGNGPLVAPLMEENDINAVDGWGPSTGYVRQQSKGLCSNECTCYQQVQKCVNVSKCRLWLSRGARTFSFRWNIRPSLRIDCRKHNWSRSSAPVTIHRWSELRMSSRQSNNLWLQLILVARKMAYSQQG